MGLQQKQGLLIDRWARRMLRVSVAFVNWLWPSPRTIEYQVTLSYAGVDEVRVTQPLDTKSTNEIMVCPSYPMGSSEAVFAKRFNKQKKFTFLNARSDRPQEAVGDHIRGEERLYRLAGRCVTSGCLHWTGEACQLGATVASVKIRRKHESYCAIRSSCRWYAENSNDACSTCAYIHHSTLLSSGRVQ
jgi:hypothetical protein